jgi:dihydroorotate dehydrogenase (fumarate)
MKTILCATRLSQWLACLLVKQVAFHASSPTTINTYGYSPHPLSQYLEWIQGLLSESGEKPIIISITSSSAKELAEMVASIQQLRAKIGDSSSIQGVSRVGIELNSSCPNIRGHPPPSYAVASGTFTPLLDVLSCAAREDPTLTVGVKLPPYVHEGMFQEVVEELKKQNIHFLTCTNTLGGCLLFEDQVSQSATAPFAVPGKWGGMAGEFLHPLALG